MDETKTMNIFYYENQTTCHDLRLFITTALDDKWVPKDVGLTTSSVAECSTVAIEIAPLCTECTRYIHNRVAGLPTWAPPNGNNVNR